MCTSMINIPTQKYIDVMEYKFYANLCTKTQHWNVEGFYNF